MTMKIYGPAMSPSVARVLAVLHEKNVKDFERVSVNLMTGEQKKPDFMAIQPFAQVPVMVEGSFILYESRAISRYVAHKFEGQGTPLYGATAQDAALVEQWLEVESQTFNPPITGIIFEKLRKVHLMKMKTDEAALAAHTEKFCKVMDVYEAALSKSKYLAGDFFSLADLSHLPSLSGLVDDGQVVDFFQSRPHVQAWWADISARPSWKAVRAVILDEVAAFQPPPSPV